MIACPSCLFPRCLLLILSFHSYSRVNPFPLGSVILSFSSFSVSLCDRCLVFSLVFLYLVCFSCLPFFLTFTRQPFLFRCCFFIYFLQCLVIGTLLSFFCIFTYFASFVLVFFLPHLLSTFLLYPFRYFRSYLLIVNPLLFYMLCFSSQYILSFFFSFSFQLLSTFSLSFATCLFLSAIRALAFPFCLSSYCHYFILLLSLCLLLSFIFSWTSSSFRCHFSP